MLSNVMKKFFATSGSLFTWGQTTFGWGRLVDNNLYTPGLVQGFNNVTHVATGPYHLAFLTSGNQVYTVGNGKYGQLGTGQTSNEESPIKVDIEEKIKQLACGERHTLALTESGNVWAWGYGGNSSISRLFDGDNPLGTGQSKSQLKPIRVDIQNVQQISAGLDFTLAVAQDKVWGWGEGLKYLYQDTCSQPNFLNAINDLCEQKHSKVKKVASVDKFAMFLLQNGRLYAIGRNIGGATATRHNAKIITDNTLKMLTKINDHPLNNQKIEDFEISANSLILKTSSDTVYYSGMHSKYMPTRFPINTQAKSIWATRNSVGIIGVDGKIYFLNDPIVDDYDHFGEVMVSDEKNLKGAFKIGGSHLLRFALRA